MYRTDRSLRSGAMPRPLDTKTIERPYSGEAGAHGYAHRERSSRSEVRNPLLKLRAAEQIRALPPQVRQALGDLLLDLSRDARERAQRSWRQNKAPMALYWKVVSVYAGHLHRVVRPSRAEMARMALERSGGHASTPSKVREGA